MFCSCLFIFYVSTPRLFSFSTLFVFVPVSLQASCNFYSNFSWFAYFFYLANVFSIALTFLRDFLQPHCCFTTLTCFVPVSRNTVSPFMLFLSFGCNFLLASVKCFVSLFSLCLVNPSDFTFVYNQIHFHHRLSFLALYCQWVTVVESQRLFFPSCSVVFCNCPQSLCYAFSW